MKLVPQLAAIVVIVAIAVPLAARFVPATHPWLAKANLLETMTAIGIVPSTAADTNGGSRPGGQRPGGGAQVIAAAPERQVQSNVIAAIGSARGAQSVDLSFGVTGRINALRAAPGQQITAGRKRQTLGRTRPPDAGGCPANH